MKTINYNAFRINQNGFTLIEIMLAMMLGLLLMIGTIQIFISSKTTSRVEHALARLQENGRFAINFIAKDLRMAGYKGCISRDSSTLVNSLKNPANFLNNFAIPMQGFEATSTTTWTPALDTTIATGTQPNNETDVISIRMAEATNAAIASPGMTAVNTNPITMASTIGISSGDIIIIADCQGSAVTQAINVTSTTVDRTNATSPPSIPGNNSLNLGRAFNDRAVILRADVITYFVSIGASGEPVLWRLFNNRPRSTNNPTELIEGIENMQILYGEDSDNDGAANIYRIANIVSDWDRVVSVRISLLLRSTSDNLVAQPQNYIYNGVTTTASDHRIRQVFTTTLSIRNRAIQQ